MEYCLKGQFENGNHIQIETNDRNAFIQIERFVNELNVQNELGLEFETQIENELGIENENEPENEPQNGFQNETEVQNELKMNSQNGLQHAKSCNSLLSMWDEYKELHHLNPITDFAIERVHNNKNRVRGIFQIGDDRYLVEETYLNNYPVMTELTIKILLNKEENL